MSKERIKAEIGLIGIIYVILFSLIIHNCKEEDIKKENIEVIE